MRRKAVALLMLLVFVLIISVQITPLPIADSLHQFYVTHFLEDTGALNSVTAIYLDYRLFDSLFETLLLLVSIIGIIHFSRHEGDY